MIDWRSIELAEVEKINGNEDVAEEYFNLLVNVSIVYILGSG